MPYFNYLHGKDIAYCKFTSYLLPQYYKFLPDIISGSQTGIWQNHTYQQGEVCTQQIGNEYPQHLLHLTAEQCEFPGC
jgi:hypothetical protein